MQAEKRHQEQLEQRNSSRELSQELPSLPAAAQAGPQQQAPPSAKVTRHTAQHSKKEGRTDLTKTRCGQSSCRQGAHFIKLHVPDTPGPPHADAVPATRVHFHDHAADMIPFAHLVRCTCDGRPLCRHCIYTSLTFLLRWPACNLQGSLSTLLLRLRGTPPHLIRICRCRWSSARPRHSRSHLQAALHPTRRPGLHRTHARPCSLAPRRRPCLGRRRAPPSRPPSPQA